MSQKSTWSVGLLLCALLFVGGCMERKMVITSEPSGADVWVNETWHGETPFTLPFKHYGVYAIRLEKPGYYPMYVKEPVAGSAIQHMPFDLIPNVAPGTYKDVYQLHYMMEPISEPDEIAGILSRADAMVAESLPLLEERQRYDETRTPVDIPLLPELEPQSVDAGDIPEGVEVNEEDVADITEKVKRVRGSDLDDLPPIQPLE